MAPLLVVAPDTSRAAKFVPSPVRSTVPLLTKEFAVTDWRRKGRLADIQRAGVGQRAAIDRVEPPSRIASRPRRPLLTSGPVVDTEAPLEIEVPATSASPVSALFEPSAVLSSMKALFPKRINREPARSW